MYHTPYLIDMITSGSMIIPDLKVNVSDQFIVPEQRYHQFVPGSPKGHVTVFGKNYNVRYSKVKQLLTSHIMHINIVHEKLFDDHIRILDIYMIEHLFVICKEF